MQSVSELVKGAKVEELHRVTETEGEKFICFTRLEGDWIICVTDVISLWRIQVDIDELDALRDVAGVSTIEAYLGRFRNGFLAGEVNVAVIGNKVTLTVGKVTSALTLDLFEAKAADKKVEMQNVLFRLAESATSLETKLSKANETIETMKAQKGANFGSGGSAFMDLGPKKGQSQAKLKPKKAGMSAINPTSKKRKAAQGVVFD
ncbi:hypothetical protein ACJMK2_038004 [Sinanodonta woodiana]|uniref:Uncharacterized protein n=1 Tax=Sinanodonta woodiana TaxID=1069815 RepID=A0ABD3WP11_SINWO